MTAKEVLKIGLRMHEASMLAANVATSDLKNPPPPLDFNRFFRHV